MTQDFSSLSDNHRRQMFSLRAEMQIYFIEIPTVLTGVTPADVGSATRIYCTGLSSLTLTVIIANIFTSVLTICHCCYHIHLFNNSATSVADRQ